jgi:hypothetical protein
MARRHAEPQDRAAREAYARTATAAAGREASSDSDARVDIGGVFACGYGGPYATSACGLTYRRRIRMRV